MLSTSRGALPALVVALALGLAAALWAVTAAPSASADATVDRLAGDDRFDTAVAISEDTFPDAGDVDVAYVATGFGFPDALAAGAVAAELGGPVLLTVTDELLPVVADELDRLDPDEVVLAGGEAVLSEGVADAVADQTGAEVRRLAGDATTGRFGTAAELATDAFADGSGAVFVATGGEFPDALAGGAGAASLDAPLLLATGNELTAATRDAIEELDPDRAILLGGTDALGSAVAAELQGMVGDVERYSGAGRWETAVDVSANSFLAAQTVYVATGFGFPDALAGSPAAGVAAGPLLLTPTDELHDAVAAELRALNPRRVVVLGGTGAVADSVIADINRALEGGTALPGGRLDFAFTNVEPREGEALQTVAIGTTDGGHEVITNPPDGFFDVGAQVAPDGELLAFFRSERAGPRRDLYLVDATIGAGSTKPLVGLGDVADGCVVSTFAWHPDGDRLAVVCVPEGGDNAEGSAASLQQPGARTYQADEPTPRAYLVGTRGNLEAVPADGGAADEAHLDVAFGPEGDLTVSRVLLDADGMVPPDGFELAAFDADDLGAGSRTLATNDEGRQMLDPQWSDDGSTLATLEAHGGVFGEPTTSVLVFDADGTVRTRLYDDGSAAAPDRPALHGLGGLTPDGGQLVVVTDDEDLDHSILRLVDTADGSATRLIDEGDLDTSDGRDAAILGADLSPTGGRVILDDVDEEASLGGARQFVDGRVVVVDVDTGELAEQEPRGVNRGVPSWSPTAD